MVALALLLSVAPVTFDAPAMPAGRLLAQLGPKLGMRLETTIDTRDDVLLVHVKNVDADTLLAKIAQAAEAEWIKKPNGIRQLVRPPALVQKQRQAVIARRAVQIRKAIEIALPQAKSQWSRDRAREIAAMENERYNGRSNDSEFRKELDEKPSMPVPRMVIQLLATIPAEELAAMTPGYRVVYSTKANRRQRQLPPASEALWPAFLREQALFGEAQRAAQGERYGRQSIGGVSNSNSGDGDPTRGVGEAHLVLNWNGPGRLRAQLVVEDPTGGTIAYGESSIGIGTPLKKEPDPRPFELPEEQRQFAKAFTDVLSSSFDFAGPRTTTSNAKGTATYQVLMPLAADPPISEEMRSRLLQPEKFDPLWLTGEAVSAVADIDGVNLVAALPDVQAYNAAIILSKPTTVGDVRYYLLNTLSQEKKDGWLVARPSNGAEARRSRTNRAAFGAALRALDRQGVLRLDDWAALAQANEERIYTNSVPGVLMRMVRSSVKPTLDSISWEMLRFWAGLSPLQKQVLLEGRTMPLETLANASREALSTAVFARDYGVSVEGWRKIDKTSSRGIMAGRDIAAEATEVVPDEFRGGTLTLRLDAKPGAYAVEEASGVGRFLSISDLASQVIQGEFENYRNAYGPALKFSSYFPMVWTQVSLNFRFAPKVTLTKTLEDVTYSPSARPTPYADLPAEFREAVAREVNTMRDVLTYSGG